MIKHNLVTQGEVQNLTVLVNGELQTASNEHPNWKAILQAVVIDGTDDESAVERLFDVGKAVKDRFQKVSERATVQNGHILFDGDPVDNALTKQIIRFLDEDLDFAPLVNFLERLMQNPNAHSREQLYPWLEKYDYAITPEGKFVAYKGVKSDGEFTSVHSGPGVVDGVPVTQVTNKPGSVVEIARSKVQHDPTNGCASGLHAGTWAYASGFGQGVTLEVHVDPRDVVSVPTDCASQKIRTCRYTVVRQVDAPSKGALVASQPVDEDGPEFDDFSPESSFIDSVDWDGDEGTITVFLDNGRWYEYDAPYSVFKAFKAADSAGGFYNTQLKDNYVLNNEGDDVDRWGF